MKIKLWAVYIMSWDENHEYTSVRMFGTKKEAQKLMNDEFTNATNPRWYDVLSTIDGDSHKKAVYCDDRGGVEYTLREEYVDVDEFAVVKPVTRKAWTLVAVYSDGDVKVVSNHLSRDGAVVAMNEYVKPIIDDLFESGIGFTFDVTGDKIVISIEGNIDTMFRVEEREVPV